jgi:hypothetical protein
MAPPPRLLQDEAVKLAARQPLLLLTDAGSLDARLGTLAYLLELPRAAAQQMAVARPRLLTVDAGAMHSCLLLLRQVGPGSPLLLLPTPRCAALPLALLCSL